MAHRKLQQEIDRVFKKINEGLEVFNTYYDRHEACTNNPSQKDKLESDLKREVKKLQRLREQIKSWQSSPEVKDKDSLLDYRRSVEVAMEKYKAVEKASKEKAYSNISLKRSEVLDPQERERRIVADYLSQSIDELERQYDLLQVEVDRLLLLNKKKKTATSANEEKKKGLKELQARYRWHQQQMELALRLIANEELDPQLVKDIEDDINYFIESNQAPDFVEDDTIYEGLNLDANEAIAHEVAASFAAQASDDAAEEEASKDTSKISKKEQRRLEREAKKAAKAAAKTTVDGAPSIATTTTTTPPPPPPPPLETAISALTEASKGRPEASISTPAEPPKTATTNTSPSPSPMIASAPTSIPSTANTTTATIASAASISKPQTPLSKPSPHNLTRTSTPEPQGHTHFHQSLNGTTTTSTLKPATVPVRPAGELKWAVAAAQAAEKDKKHVSNQNPLTATSSATSSRPNSVVSTPMVSKSSLVTQEKPPTAASVLTAGVIATASPVAQAMGLSQQPQQQQQQQQHPTSGSMEVGAASNNFTNSLLTSQVPEEESHELELLIDDYNSDLSDDELEEEPRELVMDEQELNRRSQIKKSLEESMCDNIGLLCLPSGIQDFIMCSVVSKNKLHIDGKLGGYRRPLDACKVSRLDPIPLGVNPPSPLDALRSTNQWDLIRCTIFGMEPMENEISELDDILDRFRPLETFTLFYSYYYSITPLERKIAMALLKERNWKISKGGNTWFLRQSATKFSNELCEVADYKIFKLDDWTVVDKLNFKLDYSVLEEIPLQATAMRQGESSMSHGQQLLQQLKQGPIPNKFSSEGIVAQK